MLLSEYIAQLQQIQAKEGDLQVINDTVRPCGCGCNIDGCGEDEPPKLEVRDPEWWQRERVPRRVVIL